MSDPHSDVYFSDLDGGNQIYCECEPVTLPVYDNNEVQAIVERTLPGLNNSDEWASGRAIYINMGGGYEDIQQLFFPYVTSALRTWLIAKRDEGEDFIYSPDDGDTEYRVNFVSNGIKFEQPANPSKNCTLNLINLGVI